MNPPNDRREIDTRRRRARRTALWVALLSVAIYGGFILMGAFGQ